MTDQSRIDRMEGVVEQIGERITSVENRLISLESTMNSRLNTLTIVVLGNVTATILAAIGVVVAVLQAG